VIEQAYLPSEEEAQRARTTVERLEAQLGATRLEGGDFVDAAMLGAARQVVAIVDRYGTSAA
jgi:citrate lyase subunit beta/citryl-CoA lyase